MSGRGPRLLLCGTLDGSGAAGVKVQWLGAGRRPEGFRDAWTDENGTPGRPGDVVHTVKGVHEGGCRGTLYKEVHWIAASRGMADRGGYYVAVGCWLPEGVGTGQVVDALRGVERVHAHLAQLREPGRAAMREGWDPRMAAGAAVRPLGALAEHLASGHVPGKTMVYGREWPEELEEKARTEGAGEAQKQRSWAERAAALIAEMAQARAPGEVAEALRKVARAEEARAKTAREVLAELGRPAQGARAVPVQAAATAKRAGTRQPGPRVVQVVDYGRARWWEGWWPEEDWIRWTLGTAATVAGVVLAGWLVWTMWTGIRGYLDDGQAAPATEATGQPANRGDSAKGAREPEQAAGGQARNEGGR